MCEYTVSTRAQALDAFAKIMTQAEVFPSTAVRLAAQACFGEIELGFGRATYNDKRANGFRVKLFVKPTIKVRGRDLYRMYKILSALAKQYKVKVVDNITGGEILVYFKEV